ncbi:MAG TPA: ABC transporter permease subunit [Candidatus Limiplasma sp.]|nr:ABC transporter permease subunit [Candidatus Limiplasma sp.]
MAKSLPRAGKVSWRRDFKVNWSIYLIFLPVLVYFLIFNYLPMFGITMAFQDFKATKGFFGSEFVGFANFIEFFSGPNFGRVLRNTLVISLLGLGIGFPLAIVFALMLNEVRFIRVKKVFQTISYLPYFVSAVVICGLIIDFVSSNGIVTNILVALGMKRQNLLTNPSYFWWINLASDIWQGTGYGAIIFIAAIAGVSQELFEAATIDGANRFQRVWHITLPSIMPTIITILILRCGMLLSVGFDKILLLYNPSIYETADVISTHVIRMGINRMQYGYSAAVGLFNSVVGTILLFGSNYLSRKLSQTSIF